MLRTAAMVAALSLCAQAQAVPASVAKLLADAREALGGETRLSAVRSFVIEGSISRGQPYSQNLGAFEISSILPDKFARTDNVVSVGHGTGVSLVDGGAGFSHHRSTTTLGFDGRRVIYEPSIPQWTRRLDLRPATEAELQTFLGQAQLAFVEVTLGLFAGSFAGAPVQFAPAPDAADAVLVTLNGSTRRLSFDSVTHLPARLDDLVYSDYREIGGVKVPFRFVRTHRTGAILEEWRVKTVRHNVTLNNRTFRR